MDQKIVFDQYNNSVKTKVLGNSSNLTNSTKGNKNSEELLEAVGGYGRYQLMIHLIAMVALSGEVLQAMSVVFTGLPSPLNITTDSKNLSVEHPCDVVSTQRHYLQPTRFSFVVEFDLSCERAWLAQMVTSAFFAGAMIGNLVFGWTSDNYGRRKTLLYIYVIFLLVGCCTSLSTNVWQLIALRFLSGVFTAPVQQLMASILSEMVSPGLRSQVVVTSYLLWPVALSMLSLIAYFIPNWKLINLIVTAPYLLFLPILVLLPEPLEWLIIKGRIQDARRLLQKISHWNKRPLASNVDIQSPKQVLCNRKISFLNLFYTKELAMTTIIMGVSFFSITISFYGLLMSSGDLSKGSSVYKNFFYSTIVELPAYLVTCYVLGRFGRKRTNLLGMVVGCIACFLLSSIPDDDDAWSSVRLSIGVFGRCFITITFMSIVPWTIELYPTTIRSQAVGFGLSMGRFSTILSPWIMSQIKQFHSAAPWGFLATLLLWASVLMMLLPETKTKLPLTDISDDIIRDHWNDSDCRCIEYIEVVSSV